MALDKKIAAAVRAAVTAENQTAAVADRLIAWLEALSDGKESLGNLDTTNRFLNDLFESIEPDRATGSDE
jgi:hypothetical protein